MTKQLALDLCLNNSYSFENFWPEQNQELIQALQHYAATTLPPLVFITGEHAAGKTHMLHALGELLKTHQTTVIVLSMRELIHVTPNILDGMEQLDAILIDDIQLVADHPAWQEALFHCYNRAQDKGCRWIVTAPEAARHLNFTLKDLSSRLSHGITWSLKSLDDTAKAHILQFRAHQLGMTLPDPVADYLIHHYSRDLEQQIQSLDKLEKLSLAQSRKLTIPFVKQALT